jgi:hypothetical protein
MSGVRSLLPGRTRTCPHCKATILESATVCPACDHHLRFGAEAHKRPQRTNVPLLVEGTVQHPSGGEAWEFSVVLSIRDDRGQELTRRVVGVGALQPSEQRTFSLAVEVYSPNAAPAAQK